jgi:hypothetical protein
MKLSAIVASAMPMPPDAEPVMPASAVTVIASFTNTLGIALSPSARTRNPGSAAMTPPKPYSDAVFVAARSAPAIAVLLPSAKRSLIEDDQESDVFVLHSLQSG